MESNPKLKQIYLALLVLAIVALSFFRESVFVNINGHIWFLYYHNDKSYLYSFLSFLLPLTYLQLYWFKWLLTLLFVALFLFLSCLVIKLLFGDKKFVKWTIYAFLAIIMIAAVSYGVGILFNKSGDGYLLARFFMGMIQSPFLLMFLIPAFFLEKNISK